jgi:hypothetical protein
MEWVAFGHTLSGLVFPLCWLKKDLKTKKYRSQAAGILELSNFTRKTPAQAEKGSQGS